VKGKEEIASVVRPTGKTGIDYVCGRLSGKGQHTSHTLLHSLHQIVECGRDFREVQALLILQADGIGKRATNVDSNLKHS
jgi:hypothetical protein